MHLEQDQRGMLSSYHLSKLKGYKIKPLSVNKTMCMKVIVRMMRNPNEQQKTPDFIKTTSIITKFTSFKY